MSVFKSDTNGTITVHTHGASVAVDNKYKKTNEYATDYTVHCTVYVQKHTKQKRMGKCKFVAHICFTCTGGAGECLKLAISYRSLSFSICKRSISPFDMLDSSIVSAKQKEIANDY